MVKKTSKVKSKKSSKKAVSKEEVLRILEKGKINFDYIKSNQFRVVRVDGAHGGIAPNGHTIQMALFSERTPIPKRETYKLEQGKLGERTAVEQRDAVIREVEIEALMDLNTAKRIVNWLQDKIDVAEQFQKELAER